MSGTYEDLHVPPSLIAFAVATTSARKVVSATFRHANMKVYSFSVPLNSSYLVNIEAWRQRLVFIRDLMRENKVINAATVDGGTRCRDIEISVGRSFRFQIRVGAYA